MCLQVEMEFLEREAEYKLVMQKELAKAKAEEETMHKIEEEERQEDFPQISRHEIPFLDVKPKLLPKEEPCEMKPLQRDLKCRRNQLIKIDTDLSIDKLVKIVRIDLIDIDYIDQSVEIDNTRIFFIDCR